MISQKASSNSMPNQAKKFIPIIWKKWFALLHGISEGEITPDDEAVDETKYGTGSLQDTIINLKFEGIHSLSGFPLDLYKLDNPSMALSELDMAAKRIHNEYKKASSKLKQFSTSTQEDFEAIDKECSVVCKLIELYYSKVSVNQENGCYYDINEDGVREGFSDQFFDDDRIKDVYETAAGYCFTSISYEIFYNLINRYYSYDYLIGVGEIPDMIVPIKGREMSFYAFLIVLMLGRNLRPDKVTYTSNGIDDEFWIKGAWAREFTDFIEWNSITENNSWIEEYMCTEEEPEFDEKGFYWYPKVELRNATGISDEDKRELKVFLKRETFDNIISYDELVSHGFEEYPYDEIGILSSLAIIEDDRSAKLDRLYRLLMKETRYYLQSREWNCGCFVSEDCAKAILARNSELNNLLKEKELRLHRIFGGEKVKDNALALIDYLDTHSGFVNLSYKPIVTNTIIRTIIDSCINNNRNTLKLIREEIDNENYLGFPAKDDSVASAPAAVPTAVKVEPGVNDIERTISELQSSCINVDGQDYVIKENVSKAKFARILVEQGYVKPRQSWKSIFRGFKNTDWENFERGIFKMSVINELTEELNWEPYGGRFKGAKSSDALTAAQLQRYFIDGDSDCKKRNKVFFKLYRKNSS